jgi:hypothetical protein
MNSMNNLSQQDVISGLEGFFNKLTSPGSSPNTPQKKIQAGIPSTGLMPEHNENPYLSPA